MTVAAITPTEHAFEQNHSCEPNCQLLPVYINEPDLDKPLLVIFTKVDIPAGEEICFSYFGDPDFDDEDSKTMSDDIEFQEANVSIDYWYFDISTNATPDPGTRMRYLSDVSAVLQDAGVGCGTKAKRQ